MEKKESNQQLITNVLISICLAIILGCAGYLFVKQNEMAERMARLEENLKFLEKRVDKFKDEHKSEKEDPGSFENLEVKTKLIDFISSIQNQYVKKNIGPQDCFTHTDFDNFNRPENLEKIKNKILETDDFQWLRLNTKNMETQQWEDLKQTGMKNFEPLQEAKFPDGQTRKGQKAQRILGEIIIGLLENYRK